MGERKKKKEVQCWFKFCTTKNVPSFQLNLDLFLFRRACCVFLPQKTDIASRMLQSQVPAPRGVVEAFLRGWGCSAPWGRGSHVSRAPLPTAIPAGHFPGATQEVSGEAATGTPRMNEALQLTLAQAGSLYWTHCGTTKRDLSCTERDKEEGQVSNFSR